MSKITGSEWREPEKWKKESRVDTFIRKIIDDVFQITGEIYPGQWEMQAEAESGKYFPRPVIHFPEITITNRYKKSMLLKDLYVTYFLRPYADSVMVPQLQGLRSTFTSAQFTSGYLHSHLRQTSNIADRRDTLPYSNFCLGSGGINNVMNQLTVGWDKEVYRLFLMSIQTYVEYESLEGGPHCTMSSVFNRDREHSNVINAQSAILKAIRLQALLSPDILTISYKKGSIKVIVTPELEKFLVEKSVDSDCVYVDEAGKSHSMGATPVSIKREVMTEAHFMGNRIPIKLADGEVPLNPKKSVHFLIKNMFIQYVESILNKKLLDNYYGIKKEKSVA